MARGVYKRGNIYWIRYAGIDGKVKFESSGSDKHSAAMTLYNKRKREVDEGKQPEIIKIKNHLFNELAEKYLLWINGRQKSEEVKTYIINELVIKYGNLPLRRFNTLLVEQFQTDNISKGLKASTINRKINVFKHMFTKAVDWNMVESETLKRVRKCKMLPDNSRRLRYLSKEECQELINSCDPHLKPIVITALNTGMRRGEILSLKWDNVDLRHGFILLDITKNGERREIPINDTLKQTFQGLTRRLDTSYVFYDNDTCKPYQNVKRSFKTACRRAKIHDFRFHDMRHTFASHLVMAGVDITTVKELLGHKTLTMTLRYSHLAPSHKVKAVNILDKTLSRKEHTIQKVYNLGGS